MDDLVKNERLGDLYAYYGGLLTKRQQDYFEDYYYDDLSLGEIAANHQVSRQAVYDNLRRSGQALLHYEDTVGMQAAFASIKTQLEQALDSSDSEKIIQSLLRQVSGDIPFKKIEE
jgi:predicted DNA-binding protein YlxM (UPF0122 family)